MKISQPFDANVQLLSKVLDLRSRNQQVIASNIANAETPGYSPAKFTFDDELKMAVGNKGELPLSQSHHAHIPIGPTDISAISGTITITEDQTGIGDENGVKVDDEMLALSENQILYEAAAQLLKKKLSMISYVVSGGQ
ncbi:flagellar basal body rod protein FlgB [Desulfopila sp. IMCC35008]|uniref:flagellar basal body rod protein FlgB n=1 Tax=Desulfopila sp. IMCC35008 TaxID=2653858 RepID=UPI0013D14EB7|nr:flagellar basal body rod protein FlgB [Desulfopila sp. IMCC35008]